ncbi:MAG: mercuric reductase [Spirochaetaceae bacterium]|jgi:pyruvate/2-oxoglutarate dehydrogenase complex dihydrolipoamide dehydrogenase (E3) component|nr:mercuric reductase [Spirochaetaceae bacterium]
MKTYDIIIIGTGQATATILPELLNMKLKIAVVESDKVGGSCVNWGCTPTKTLIASARAAHMARRGSDFGIDVTVITVDFGKIMKRINDIRLPASDGLKSWLKKVTDFYPGEASFLDEHTLKVGPDTLHGKKIIIHTGTRSRKPKISGIDTVSWLDNKGILSLEKLPEHLLVIGGSYIGLEFAQAFRRLGSRVTVLEKGERIASKEDSDISQIADELLKAEGIDFHVNTEILGLEKTNEGVRVDYIEAGKKDSLSAAHVLIAIGRVPNTDMLNLKAAGVDVDKGGFINVNEVGQTSVPHIYALGDVNGRGAFTHTSVNDGQVFLDHLKGGERKIRDRIKIYSMFIDPPLARVGMSEQEAGSLGEKVLMATKKMDTISRAREKDEKSGIIKVIVEEESKLILGATVFGVGGDEVIGILALAMQAGLPYTRLQETVLPHPTVAELVPWVFADLKPLDRTL